MVNFSKFSVFPVSPVSPSDDDGKLKHNKSMPPKLKQAVTDHTGSIRNDVDEIMDRNQFRVIVVISSDINGREYKGLGLEDLKTDPYLISAADFVIVCDESDGNDEETVMTAKANEEANETRILNSITVSSVAKCEMNENRSNSSTIVLCIPPFEWK